MLLRGIDALKTFDILYATKGKGGGSFHEVETLNIYAYGLSFDYNEYGVSSAVLIIFFLVIIGLMWAPHLLGGRTCPDAQPDAVRPGRSRSARSRPAGRLQARRTPYQTFRVVALVVVVVALMAPLVWMVSASFKTNVDIYDTSKAVFFSPVLENYTKVLQQANYLQFICNSLWVAFVSTTLSLLLGVPAAYSMSRFKMQRSALVVLMARVIPGVALLVPWYYVFSNLRMVGGYSVLILSHMFVALPLMVYIMMGFFDCLPLELEESALDRRADPHRGVPPDHAAAVGARHRDRRASCRSSSRGTTSCSPWSSRARTPRPCRWPSSTSSATPASTGAA